ncbi:MULTISPECIES: hypothetical protein [Methylobacterium]|uniref:Uncharacterized protein n=2 Tax=Pseudomonadota TaxID=1224 RepID=A0ABQ4SZQ9_9HYPH|nr:MULTISPECIES: hypothetical protein [Methylobacterium]PIU05280.1 MAG: hypothetical protein COT56_15955 [Methylobacterium sp. CG09_land_8_20_14_0_10_71_15]PIU12342.1 MAG: hypothetical protein COT28_15235 [Methylobacterium sp. CG08_land_8_20_14_0_20_71_15]GBU16848.1 hypothetical protein AwMethylo_10630 [Methylobacterium sp.]GJE08005.1 hypothetical protein AOPFMNJM_3337 [Methylobacterium jeotgali]
MKLSNQQRVKELIFERTRLRESIQDALSDEDIKIEIRGRPAQGVLRERIRAALTEMWQEDLRENTERLKSLGVEADDGPVHKPNKTRLPSLDE